MGTPAALLPARPLEEAVREHAGVVEALKDVLRDLGVTRMPLWSSSCSRAEAYRQEMMSLQRRLARPEASSRVSQPTLAPPSLLSILTNTLRAFNQVW